jgi:chemotaxis protein CheX
MINFGQQEIEQLTYEIWESMLNINLQPDPAQHPTPGDTRSPFGVGTLVGSCVQITGAWEGAVQLTFSSVLARRAAAAFLGVEPEEVNREQIRDAVGELANMSAGSIKPLLPRPCQISLPSVVDGTDYELTVRNGRRVLRAGFVHEGELLVISITEAEKRAIRA